MLRLQMESQPLQYELSMQSARLDLTTRRAAVQIESEPAIVEVSSSRGQLTIDHTPCRYSLGIKNNIDFARDFASKGRQAALEGASRIAEEGTRLASIEQGGNPIAEIAKESAQTELQTVTLVPIQPPNISYEAIPVQYNPQGGNLRFSVIPSSVNGEYQPGGVDMQITQYPSLRIWTTGSMDIRA